MSVTSVESTPYHCCLASPSTEAILTRANEDECSEQNYDPQQGAKATSATKQMGQVLCYVTHERSNMAVAVRCTLFSNPCAQSLALHAKMRPNHVDARARQRSALTESRELMSAGARQMAELSCQSW
jgi:hypothetical protein